MHWSLEELHLPLKFSWKISRNEAAEKTNFYVRCSGNKGYPYPSRLLRKMEGRGEVAPNARYGESPELIKKQFAALDFSELDGEVSYRNLFAPEIFEEWLTRQPVCNSLRFGLDSAFTHLYCHWNNTSVYELLKIQAPDPQSVTAFSLPIMPLPEMKKFYLDFSLDHFKIIKVKISQENAFETLQTVASLTHKPLLVDANEAWHDPDALLQLLEKLRKYPILFIEQPLPAHLTTEYEYLKKHSPFPLMADESVTDKADFEALSRQFHGINMKLMKAGTYRNGLAILQQTRQHALKTMIGCMVETSQGIASALHLSQGVDLLDLDSFLYLQQDPARLVKEENGLLTLLN